MGISERIEGASDLTPTEQQLARCVLDLGEDLQAYSIKDLARTAATSVASIHRFCKKLGLAGYKDLKIEVARSRAISGSMPADVDINFPFHANEDATQITPSMLSLYETTIRETAELLDMGHLRRAARLIAHADTIEIFTGSHNVYPAQMFEERLLSAGKDVSCPVSGERQIRRALAAGDRHAAIVITYSGLGGQYRKIISILKERNVPIILIGSKRARRMHPDLAAYLMVSDREDLQNRITQFASHIAVQFVLDTLYSCVFARDYERNMTFLKRSIPYTRLQRGDGFELTGPTERGR